jgi:hypothetical protein
MVRAGSEREKMLIVCFMAIFHPQIAALRPEDIRVPPPKLAMVQPWKRRRK